MTPEPGAQDSYFYGSAGEGDNIETTVTIDGTDLTQVSLDTLVNTNYGVGPGGAQIKYVDGDENNIYEMPTTRSNGTKFSTVSITMHALQFPETTYATYISIFAMKKDGTIDVYSPGLMMPGDDPIVKTYSADEYLVVSIVYQGENMG